jgi:hypothetical protein
MASDGCARNAAGLRSACRAFFDIVSDLDGPGPLPPLVDLTPQDQADMVAYMKLLK